MYIHQDVKKFSDRKEYNKAHAILDSLLYKQRKPDYLWLKANILEMETDTINALKIYRELSNTENNFTEMARNRLKLFGKND